MPPKTITTQSARMPGHLIRQLHQRATQVFTQRSREAGFDLTPVQFSALDALRHTPGIDQAGLAQAIAKDRATLGAVADRLEQKGLVKRVINPEDKRARVLTLTEQGEAVITSILPIVRSFQNDILPGLTAQEYDQFIALAAKSAQAIKNTDTGTGTDIGTGTDPAP